MVDATTNYLIMRTAGWLHFYFESSVWFPALLFPVAKFSKSEQSFDWQLLKHFHSEAGPLVLQSPLGREAVRGRICNPFTSLFSLFSSQILQVQVIFNCILLALPQWCLKGHIKYTNILTNERKYLWGLKIFWIIFSFFLAVSVMRYSASAFGFAVSNLKCTSVTFCTFFSGPTDLMLGSQRVASRWRLSMTNLPFIKTASIKNNNLMEVNCNHTM